MFGVDLIIRSKLILPRSTPHQLFRERINQHLGKGLDLPVMLVVAGPGYGKSSALADWLAKTAWPVAWYSISATDQDPLIFLLHLIYAFQGISPHISTQALQPFSQAGDPTTIRQAALVRLLNELTEQLETDTLLVLDDLHLVLESPDIIAMLNQLLDYLPPQIHLVLSSRQHPRLAALVSLEAKGQVAHLTGQDLTFNFDEAVRLLRGQYNLNFSDQQITQILTKTEGWAIALQLVARQIETDQKNTVDLDIDFENLFTFLAQDVLQRQPQNIQHFLTGTAILEQLTPAICDYLLKIDHSATILRHLADQSFFVLKLTDHQPLLTSPQKNGSHPPLSSTAEIYRYHHLFAQFLASQLTDEKPLHHQAGKFYQNEGLTEMAVHHFLQAQVYPEAVDLLTTLAPELVKAARFKRLNDWLGQLPAAILSETPTLLLAYGDLHRFTSQYQQALDYYQRALQIFEAWGDLLGQSDALRGQGQVYLDTVRPAKATHPLQKALTFAERGEAISKQVQILGMLAENEANLGHATAAQALQERALALSGGEHTTPIEVETRLLLRSGRLIKARRKLTQQAEHELLAERAAWAPRHHRETRLLLSLICAMQGDPEPARHFATEGVIIGQQLESPYVEAVGYMRLGHAWQIGLDAKPERAAEYYQQAIVLCDKFKVARAKLEPLWGLLRLHGYRGDWLTAQRYGQEGLRLAARAGDGWMGAWCELMLAASRLIAGDIPTGLQAMRQAQAIFETGGDVHGQAVSLMWQALYTPETDNIQRLNTLLELIQHHNLAYLFGKPTFTMPLDPQMATPLLLQAKQEKIATFWVNQLLDNLQLAEIETHPGFTLRVQTLGAFRVWCGLNKQEAQPWSREKARHLFQYLLIHRNIYLQKEQIFDELWPEIPLNKAEKHFKVAFNTLQNTIEPQRSRRDPSFFVRRRGSSYTLLVTDSLWLDCDQFERELNRGRRALADNDMPQAIEYYQNAIDLYQDDFLVDALYEDWTSEERHRLLALYLQGAERLAHLRLQNGQPGAAMKLGQLILSKDDCWEAAYRLLMVAYQRQGNRPQALRTFKLCDQALQSSLGISPMAQTVELYQRLLNHQNISLQDV